jgi:hypothetical protein
VTLTRDMRPYGAGQELYLPDGIAAGLIATGEAENPRPWPPTAAMQEPPVEDEPRPARRKQTYLTK